jgi:hypothetical protein
MAEKDYLQLAIEERARRQAAADTAEIDAIANAMRETDEREARHAALRKKHGLPDTANPRQISDAWIAHHKAWREFVTNAHPDKRGGYPATEILSPESVVDSETRRAEVQALQAKLRPQFEAAYDRDVAAKLAAQTRRAAA